jgi:serine/threonine-protein kinase PknG
MTTVTCANAHCGGTIDDGYCDACGLAAVPWAAMPPAGPVGGAPAAEPVRAGSQAGSSGSAARPAGLAAGSEPATVGTGRGSLGAGLVAIPPVLTTDPAAAVLQDPRVHESKRFCASCGEPVGRGGSGRTGRTEGFCKNCGATFSFRPRLSAGELVADQYEVLGCLAHGGLGWIYLARDRNVSDRWVVLKGLLNSGDADAQAAAVAERHFLAEVEHPNIVRIYNFVQHADSQTGEPAGYIVMEYVGGRSLRQILLDRRAERQSLPVAHALAYAIEVLPALGYLHRLGLVYCDFKPDNVIQVEEQVKLIDLGGVRRIDDQDGPIYGTVGYQAPEIAADGPSPSSDLYTVGRALAVLTFEFTGYTKKYQHELPDRVSVGILAQQESFFRLLHRATDTDPGRRFTSTAEMADQMTGVLREVLSVADGTPRPAFSRVFSPELQAIGAATATGPASQPGRPAGAEMVAGLPVPLVDGTDPAAGYLATLGALSPEQLADSLEAAIAAPPGSAGGIADSPAAQLALARARIVLGNVAGAQAVLSGLARRGAAGWRLTWHSGLADLASGRLARARAAFDAVYDFLPGELAPKLALALAIEADGEHELARRYFGVVWSTDRTYVSAACGLARVLLATGDRRGAVDVLSTVPESSAYWLAAQTAAVRAQIGGTAVTAADVTGAGHRLDRLSLDASMRHTLATEVLQTALAVITAGASTNGSHLLGCELTETGLRHGLERSYRALARLTTPRHARYALVDLANDVRPRTLV